MSVQTDRVRSWAQSNAEMEVCISPSVDSALWRRSNTSTHIGICRQTSYAFKGSVAKVVCGALFKTSSVGFIGIGHDWGEGTHQHAGSCLRVSVVWWRTVWYAELCGWISIEGRNWRTGQDTVVDACTVLSIIGQRTNINTDLCSYTDKPKSPSRAMSNTSLCRILSIMIEPTIKRRPTYFCLIIGIVQDRRRMTPWHTNPVGIIGLRFNIRIQVTAYKYTSSGVIVPPKSSTIWSWIASVVRTTTSQHTLPQTYISIVCYWFTGNRIQRTLCHTSLGCGVTPGRLDSTASIT